MRAALSSVSGPHCQESCKGVFSTGAMGALAPAILKNRLLAPTIFGHFSTVGNN